MAVEKAKDRLEVLERIDEYERKRWFSKDVENDPPTKPLLPNQVDYLNEKLINRILTKFVNAKARKFIDNLIEKMQLAIAEVKEANDFDFTDATCDETGNRCLKNGQNHQIRSSSKNNSCSGKTAAPAKTKKFKQ